MDYQFQMMFNEVKKELDKLGIVIIHVDNEYRLYYKGSENSNYFADTIDDAYQLGKNLAANAERRKLVSDPAKLMNIGTDRKAYEEAVIAGAVSYSVCKKMGVGQVFRRNVTTLEEVAKIVLQLGVDQTMVYAINKDGRSVLMLAGGKPITNR